MNTDIDPGPNDLIHAAWDIDASQKKIAARIAELGAKTSVHTFTGPLPIRWSFYVYGQGTYYLDQYSADFIDFGNKGWMLAGTASGYSYIVKREIRSAASLEYKAADDSLTWSVFQMTQVFLNVSTTSDSVQMKRDLNPDRLVVINRIDRVPFAYHFLELGSYLTRP